MSRDSEFSFDVLEWDKILSYISGYSVSELGRDLTSSIQPLNKTSEIRDHLQKNIECKHIIETSGRLPISGCSDMTGIFSKLEVSGMILYPDDINIVIKNLTVAQEIFSVLKDKKTEFPGIFSLAENLTVHDKIVKDLRRKIDEDGSVLDSATPKLKKLRSQIRSRRDDLKSSVEKLVKQFSKKKVLQEDHYTIRNGRYVIPVKEKQQRSVQGITHDISSKGATVFIEPLEIVEKNNFISFLEADEADEIRRILEEITAGLSEILPDLKNNQTILAQLDYFYACGMFAYKMEANVPEITEDGALVLRDAKHPLLVMQTKKKEDIIPLTLTLGEDFNTLIISGPNAGGKTVALKTAGLLSLMAQAGIPVPVSPDSQFPVFKRIKAVIGDPQSIDDNLSTFSARLLQIKSIVDNMSEHDLVLIDELGAGTDPQEGVSLAIAIIKFITDIGAKMIVTTHHGGLKIFANDSEKIENASLSFDEDSLLPTYNLSVGIPGSSYALELSKKIGLPEEIIYETKNRLGEKQLKVEDFLKELESRISFYRKKGEELEGREKKLKKTVSDYDKKLAELDKDFQEKFENAVRESEEKMIGFNKEFEHLVKELRETKASHESIKKAKEAIEQETQRIKKQKETHTKQRKKYEKKVPAGDIEIGSTVKMKGFDQKGIITGENRDKNTFFVQMNSIKMEVKKDKLVQAQPDKVKVEVRGKVPIVHVGPEVDLRGMQADDALEAVDNYIAEAVTGGLKEIRIIHGKGTGKLRRVVNSLLKEHNNIAEFRLGMWGEGDVGVTIATLK
ncbi:endonuclease MutS2 [candidate division KSB1 bacterium]